MIHVGVVVLCLVVTAGSAIAAGDEPTPISEIIGDPEAYHLRLVTLRGTVQLVQPLQPYFQPSGAACYGAYLFVLQDETGWISVAVLGVCGVPVLRPPEVSEGETVVVQAEIQALDQFGFFRDLNGRPIRRGDGPAVQAIAKAIVHLGD